MFKLLSIKRRQNRISQLPQLMGVAKKLWYFPLSSLGEVGIRSCKFQAAASPGTRVSFICGAQYSPNHKALTCKSDNRVKSRVSNERTEAEILSIFLHLEISLLLRCRSQLGHKSIYDLLNLAKLAPCNGLLLEGNWPPSRQCTFADYSWVTMKDTCGI